jgi:hypothetical protein
MKIGSLEKNLNPPKNKLTRCLLLQYSRLVFGLDSANIVDSLETWYMYAEVWGMA